ncbi:hypothetical protein RIF29_30045 [Crotalaria pallida]|uniref:Uncharacterized protein n=1 Tax=Crotalaria pallida TaxID=3830 RepID=A0AAN9EHY6_CROPI
MARKKGRPPKSPSPHPSPIPNTIPKNLDLLNLDDEDMEDKEDLIPKKVGSILKKLDELRAKIKGKAIVEEEGEGMDKDLITLNTTTQNTSTQNLDPTTIGEQPRRASIWDSFDITKLRNAGEKLNFIEEGKIPEANIEIATEAVKEALKDKCVEEEEEVSVVKETQPERMDKEQKGQNEKDQKEEKWNPVMTRRKGQFWSLEDDGYAMFRIMRNQKRLKVGLGELNNRKYRDIDRKESQAREKLDVVQELLQNDPMNTHLQKMEREAREEHYKTYQAAVVC